MKRLLLVLSVQLFAALTACTERLLPTNVGQSQQAEQTATLQLTFLLQAPSATPDTPEPLLQKLQSLLIELRQGSKLIKSERLSLDASNKQAAEINRTWQQMPVGALELRIHLRDGQDQDVQAPLVQNLKTLSQSETRLQIALYGAAARFLSNDSPVQQLKQLWQEELSLQREVQLLSQQQASLLTQARLLLKSSAPEDRIQLEQLRTELNTLAQQLEPKQSRIQAIETALQELEAQSMAKDMVQLLRLLQQATSLRQEVENLLQRRGQLFNQSKVLLSQGMSAQEQLSQTQSELQTVNESLHAKQAELEAVVAELEKLQVQVVTASAASLTPSQIQAQLEELKPALEQLANREIELKQLIASLVEKTDLRNVQRRESYEAELRILQNRLSELRAQQAALQQRLETATS